MLTLIAAFLLAPAPEPMLAFSARIYYPPGDKRTSHQQLYVSDLHGGHRKQLTHGSSDVQLVRWVDKSAIFWTVGDDCYISRQSPFKPRKISIPKDAEHLHGTPRGKVVFTLKEAAYEVTPKGVVTGELSKWADSAPVSTDSTGEASNYTMPGGKVLKIFRGDNDWTLTYDSQDIKVRDENILWLYPEAARDGTLYIRGEDVAGADHGHNATIYSVDFAAKKLNKIVGDLAYLDFSLDSPYYCGGTDGGSGTTPYGPKKVVWSSSLYAGDLKTGKRWLVLGGLVQVVSASVQP